MKLCVPVSGNPANNVYTTSNMLSLEYFAESFKSSVCGEYYSITRYLSV